MTDQPKWGEIIRQREIRHLVDEVERLRGLLTSLEWEGAGPEYHGTFCPACQHSYLDGHARDCWLAEEVAGEWPLHDEGEP